MGLDFSHCEARWGYGGFNRFRTKLFNALGGTQVNSNDWVVYLDESKDDPIYPLLNHSDCDGELLSSECEQIIPRLRQIVAIWPDGSHDKEAALELIRGMEAAIDNNESLEFC